jgi:hypothetical protein
LGKSISRLRAELSQKSGHDFQNLFGMLLGELLEGSSLTRKMGHYDQAGVDVLVIKNDDEIGTAIQCKGFELLDYGPDQHRQCRREIAKYINKGPPAREYWLVVNRPITDRPLRMELEADLGRLVASGKAGKVELLDREPMQVRLRKLAGERLAAWADAKRVELFSYYESRLRFVQYIASVPFNCDPVRIDPAAHIGGLLRKFFDGLPQHRTGKYRRAPKFIVTSGFGFGKTSTLQALARNWIESGGHAIYAPAALLDEDAFKHAAGLTDALLEFLIPDNAEIRACLQLRRMAAQAS